MSPLLISVMTSFVVSFLVIVRPLGSLSFQYQMSASTFGSSNAGAFADPDLVTTVADSGLWVRPTAVAAACVGTDFTGAGAAPGAAVRKLKCSFARPSASNSATTSVQLA